MLHLGRSCRARRRSSPLSKFPLVVAVAIASVAGCERPEKSNSVDLEEVAGAPVRLRNVHMAEVWTASLGTRPVSASGSSDPNGISIVYDADLTAQAAPHSGTAARIACRVADHTVVQPLAHDAMDRLSRAEVGTTFSAESTTFRPTAFSSGIPTVCETELYYSVSPPLSLDPDTGTVDRSTKTEIGTVCFAGGKLVTGPCDPSVLPRTPAASALELSRLVGSIGPRQDGGFGLEASILVTAGEDVPDELVVGADARCQVDGTLVDAKLHLFLPARDLRPGESLAWSGSSTPHASMHTEPTWCTVTVSMVADGHKTPLGESCIRAADVTPGPCT